MPWEDHFSHQVYYVLTGSPVILNHPGRQAAIGRDDLTEAGLDHEQVIELVAAIEPEWYPHGVVIDVQFALLKMGPGFNASRDGGSYRQLIDLCRVKLPGTDGMRGRVNIESNTGGAAIAQFLTAGIVTPALFGLAARALGLQLRESGLLSEGDTAVFGQDGRDLLTDYEFSQAVIQGFNQAGISVVDTGEMPTPGVVLYGGYAGCRVGAILTASHNPSDQNGLKFIYDGFKLPEEGPEGEFALTARMYLLANEAPPASVPPQRSDVHSAAVRVLIDTTLANCNLTVNRLAQTQVVIDAANGAYSRVLAGVMDRLGLNWHAVNIEPLGHNINQGGGVAEIEGTAFFTAADLAGTSLATLREIGRLAQEHPIDTIYGIVLDGDGDRGYLLVYDRERDGVWVLPGDEVAVWIAMGMLARGELTADSIFVSSVESDIRVGEYVDRELGLRHEKVCVGDKWLLMPVKAGRKFAVGAEESGHVTFGCRLLDKDQSPIEVFTGNGLLSTLKALQAIHEQQPDLIELVHPFPPGIKAIRYVYFVDKARFYRGSPVWREDMGIVNSIFSTGLPAGFSWEEIVFENDLSMLYLAVFDQRPVQVGSLFVRNSGTENKIGVAIRCIEPLQAVFQEAMTSIHNYHLSALKDSRHPDALLENLYTRQLGDRTMSLNDLKAGLDSELGPVPEARFQAILYAMRKQGLLKIDGDQVSLA